MTSAPPFLCALCLTSYPSSARDATLACAHDVCSPCLGAFWAHAVESRSDPFPRCPLPFCPATPSSAALAALLPPAAVRRLQQLRSLRPARTRAGARLFCSAPACHEPLPPPPPAAEPPHATACPRCGTGACARCGGCDHDGACATPAPSGRDARLYAAYAVGRVCACPACGVHAEHDGGCRAVSCGQCGTRFDFVPFRSVEEAREVPLAPAGDGSAQEDTDSYEIDAEHDGDHPGQYPGEYPSEYSPDQESITEVYGHDEVSPLPLFSAVCPGLICAAAQLALGGLQIAASCYAADHALTLPHLAAGLFLVIFPFLATGVAAYIEALAVLAYTVGLLGRAAPRANDTRGAGDVVALSVAIVAAADAAADRAPLWMCVLFFAPSAAVGSALLGVTFAHFVVVSVGKAARRASVVGMECLQWRNTSGSVHAAEILAYWRMAVSDVSWSAMLECLQKVLPFEDKMSGDRSMSVGTALGVVDEGSVV